MNARFPFTATSIVKEFLENPEVEKYVDGARYFLDWFLSGLHMYNLIPLSLSYLIGKAPMREKFAADLFPYVLAWRQGILNEQQLLQG